MLHPTYMAGFFARLDRLNRRRQPRRATSKHGAQVYTKLNPTYTY